MEALFKAEFAFDPSLKADEVEGSVPQALMLMNNPQLNDRIQAKVKVAAPVAVERISAVPETGPQ